MKIGSLFLILLILPTVKIKFETIYETFESGEREGISTTFVNIEIVLVTKIEQFLIWLLKA